MKKQQGFVLLFTVILLFVAAMMGLYAMRSTITQDKMTANRYNKTITTNAAEHGAAAFYEWAKNRFTNNGWPTSTSDKNAWTSVIPDDNTGTINSGTNGYYWIDTTLRPAGCTSNPCWNNDTKQVTALITGNLIKGSGENRAVLGESVYQIKIAAPGSLKLPPLPAALTLGGTVNSFGAANSHNFEINGGDKPAIATMEDGYKDIVSNAIKNNDNNGKVSKSYTGGNCTGNPCVTSLDLGIWEQPNQLMEYINTIKNDPSVKYFNKATNQTVTDANLDLTKPINIVEGNYTQNGNMPDYKGVLIVLGANNAAIKGGGGSNFTGGMYFANITGSVGNYSFSPVVLTTNGAHMSINYDGTYFGNSNNGIAGYASQTTILSWSDIL